MNCSRVVWNGITKIIYSNLKTKVWLCNCLLINTIAVIDPKDIAEHFNNYLLQ